ncbi:MAG: cache domain-containing protein [Methanomicrobiaceae archaeon]|nr:cache domain-containing protein [Methanomicrobiaceae archaeon]
MKRGLYFLYITVIAVFFVLSSGCTSGENPSFDAISTSDEHVDNLMQSSLLVLQGDTYRGIEDLFLAAKECSGLVYTKEASSNTTSENQINIGSNSELSLKMSEIISENKHVLSVAYIGNDGLLKELLPESDDLLPGDSLSYQDSVVLMNENKIPMLTDLFELKQGGYGAAVYYPVFSGDIYTGFISIAFKPEKFFSEYAALLKEKSDLEVMVLQTDGIILYDPDESETGTPTFNNPEYAEFPEIIEAAEKIVKEWSGNTEYSYYSTGTKKTVKKRQFWTTVAAGENEWKITVIRNK